MENVLWLVVNAHMPSITLSCHSEPEHELGSASRVRKPLLFLKASNSSIGEEGGYLVHAQVQREAQRRAARLSKQACKQWAWDARDR